MSAASITTSAALPLLFASFAALLALLAIIQIFRYLRARKDPFLMGTDTAKPAAVAPATPKAMPQPAASTAPAATGNASILPAASVTTVAAAIAAPKDDSAEAANEQPGAAAEPEIARPIPHAATSNSTATKATVLRSVIHQPGRSTTQPTATRAKAPKRVKPVKKSAPANRQKYMIKLMTVADANSGLREVKSLTARQPGVLKRFKTVVEPVEKHTASSEQKFDICVGPIAGYALATEACKALKGAGLTASRLKIAKTGASVH